MFSSAKLESIYKTPLSILAVKGLNNILYLNEERKSIMNC